jgi:hypothetical protein
MLLYEQLVESNDGFDELSVQMERRSHGHRSTAEWKDANWESLSEVQPP